MRAPLHVLLVAPEPTSPAVGALRRAGYEPHVHHAATPEAFEDALEREGWDVAVLAEGAEGLGSLEVLGWLRQRRPAVPVFVLASGLEGAVALIEAGARDVLGPGEEARLGAAVAKALQARREAAREAARTDGDPAFHALAEHMPIGLYRSTEEGRILYANPALARILGRNSVEELLEGDVLRSLSYPRQAFFEEIRRTGEVRNLEVRWEHPSGRAIYTRENTRAVHDAAGRLLYYEGTMEDITEERLALEQEQRRVGQLEAIVRFSAAVDAALSAEDLHAAIVRAVEETLGADAAVLVQREDGRYEILAWSESIPLEGLLACGHHELWRSYPAHSQPFLIEDIERLEGAEHGPAGALPEPLEALMRQVGFRALGSFPLLHHGRPLGIVLALFRAPRAFTEGELRMAETLSWHVAVALSRWRAEAALRQSEGRYRTVSDLASDYAYATRFGEDGQASIEWATEALRRISGYAPEEIEAAGGLLHLVHPEDLAHAEAARRLLEEGEPIDAEFRILTRGGEERWVRHRGRPEHDDRGRLVRAYHVGQDITERKRFEAEIIEAREQAEAMARLKSAFLANMSHEIRTPLTGIIGFAGVLAEEVGREHREFAELIAKSGRRLLDTLSSVLDMARLEAEQLSVELRPLDVAAFAEEATRLLHPLAEEKGIELRFRAAAPSLVAALDPTYLSRILNNLVGNAIKFTEKGHVEVEAEAVGEEVLLRVRDTGIGIAAEFLPELFEEFRQESTGQARSHEGSGLGLSITRRLVELMGGRIGVESEKGEGSVFTVAFPRSKASPLGDGQPERRPEAGLPVVAVAPRTPAPEGEERLRVLVAEGTPERRAHLAQILGETAEVEAVGQPRAVLEALAAHAYDVLVLDASLGGAGSGAAILRIVQTLPGCEGMATVALAAHAGAEALGALREAGFDVCVAESYTRERLLAALRKARAAASRRVKG